MSQWRGRSRGRGLYRYSLKQQRKVEGTPEHVGLVYPDEQTVSSLQHLDPRTINLKIIVWLTKPEPGDKPTIVTVSRFEQRHGQFCIIGHDTKKYDPIVVPGDTPLEAYSY